MCVTVCITCIANVYIHIMYRQLFFRQHYGRGGYKKPLMNLGSFNCPCRCVSCHWDTGSQTLGKRIFHPAFKNSLLGTKYVWWNCYLLGYIYLRKFYLKKIITFLLASTPPDLNIVRWGVHGAKKLFDKSDKWLSCKLGGPEPRSGSCKQMYPDIISPSWLSYWHEVEDILDERTVGRHR